MKHFRKAAGCVLLFIMLVTAVPSAASALYGVLSRYFSTVKTCAPAGDDAAFPPCCCYVYAVSGMPSFIAAEGDGSVSLKDRSARSVLLFEKRDDGSFRIKDEETGRFLAVSGIGDGTDDVIRPVFSASAASPRNRWYILRNGDGCLLQNAAADHLFLTPLPDGTPIMATKTVPDAQSFRFVFEKEKEEGSTGTRLNAYLEFDTSARVWDDERDYPILTNIIGAVESGNQVYGKRDYGAYMDPYTLTENEHTVTLGWMQCYGENAMELIRRIREADPEAFRKADPKNLIGKALERDWESTGWAPTEEEKEILINLIRSRAGCLCQDAMFTEYMRNTVRYCVENYTDNAWAVHMFCEISHLGGRDAGERVFDDCAGRYTLTDIMRALDADQDNPRSDYQVGDAVFFGRHVKCCEFLQKYAR